MKSVLPILITLISIVGPVQAGRITPTIEAVDEDLIFLSNGRVIFKDQLVGKQIEQEIINLPESPVRNYTPTILPDKTEANNIFELMRTDYQENGQCYNMAHVWAYEEYKRSGQKSQKI